jgi:repressor LexA
MPLTKRQFQVLFFLDRFVQEKGYCPSFDEIGKSLHLSSLATVHKHLNTLERKGFIRRDYNRSRSIEVVNREPSTSSQGEASGRRRRGLLKICSCPVGPHCPQSPLEAVPSSEPFAEGVRRKQECLYCSGKEHLDGRGSYRDGDFVVVEKTQSAEDSVPWCTD